MKKLFSILLVLVLMMSFSICAFAEGGNTITVNNAKEGETYKAFKMLDLNVDDPENPTAYTYTVNTDWAGFFSEENKSVWENVFVIDAQGYVTAVEGIESETAWSATSELSKFAEAAAKYAKDNNLTPVDSETCAEGATSVVLSTNEPGYYLVTSTLGTRAMIDTTPGNVIINEKNEEDTVSKQVKEDSTGTYGTSNDAQIGDTVEFKSVASITPRSINVKIHDTMTNGLTFVSGSIKIYTDADLTTELASDMYETLATPDSGDTFTIEIKDAFAATATETQMLYITYSATLNENAVVKDENGVAIVDQNNKTKVSFGDGTSSEEGSTTTTTHKFSVFKHAKDSTDNLAGAVFSLKKAGTVVKLVKLDENNYRVANGNEEGAVETFTTVASGDIVIWGVDSDNDYTLLETEAPAGYNKLTAEVTVTVDAGNSTRVDVENKAGNELPSTGGIGTTLFYVIGGMMVVGAAVVLIARKRMEE